MAAPSPSAMALSRQNWDKPRLIDSLPPRPRERPMKVLCLGQARTGTSSLRDALKMIGYKPFHFSEMMIDWTNQLYYWIEAIEAKYYGKCKPYGREEFDKLLGRWDAIEDNPGIMFAEELIAAYPEAQVLITNRDVDAWVKSMQKTVIQTSKRSGYTVFAPLFPLSGGWWKITDLQAKVCYGDESDEYLHKFFDDYYARVRTACPPERRLELHFDSGWAPLCKFLGVREPPVPWPRSNDSDHFVGKHTFWRSRLQATVLILAGLVAVLGYGIPTLYRMNPSAFMTVVTYGTVSFVGTFFWNALGRYLQKKRLEYFYNSMRGFAKEPEKLPGY